MAQRRWVMKMGPNNARHVVWAISKLIYFLSCLIYTNNLSYGTSPGNVWHECDSYKYIYISISLPIIINQSIYLSISFPSSTKS